MGTDEPGWRMGEHFGQQERIMVATTKKGETVPKKERENRTGTERDSIKEKKEF